MNTHFFTGTYEPTIDLLPTTVAKVTGSNPIEVLNFFLRLLYAIA